LQGFGDSLSDTVALGIVVGLVAGKTVGIFGATFVMARFTRARLAEDLRWIDVAGLAVLAGIGFTGSLLIGDLAYSADFPQGDHVKVRVLLGSSTAAVIAAVILRLRNRTYRRICEAEAADADENSCPVVAVPRDETEAT